MKTQNELNYKVKELRKLSNKESQPALKRYYERELSKAYFEAENGRKNDSSFRPLRAMWKRLPSVKYELCN